LVDSTSIATATIEELLLRTSCESFSQTFRGAQKAPLFLSKYLKK
jgi:hypothetical protein